LAHQQVLLPWVRLRAWRSPNTASSCCFFLQRIAWVTRWYWWWRICLLRQV